MIRGARVFRRRALPEVSSGRRFLPVTSWWLAFFLAFSPARTEDSQRDPREAELARIRQQIALLADRLDKMKSRETSLEDDLRRTRLELDLQEKQLAEATAAFELAEARARSAAAKVSELEDALVHVREDLSRRLVGLYQLGREGYLRLFLALKPDENLLPAIRQLRFLVRRDQMVLDRYMTTRDDLAAERRTLEAQRLDMEAWQQREAERRDALVRLRRRQEVLLERLAKERRSLAEKSDHLQDKERKLVRLINSLISDSAGDPSGLLGTPIQEFYGVLDWPTYGEIVGRFGTRRDPRYQTEIPHNGIDIAPEGASAEVRAIFPGKVLYAAEFEGYGQMVVIHHPGRVFTLYSGLAELFVGKDDVISLGTLLGMSAEQLYFEIRRENQAEDPLGWLR